MRKDIARRLDILENKTGGTEIKVFTVSNRRDEIPEGYYTSEEAAIEAAAEWQDEAPHLERIAITFSHRESNPLQPGL